MKFDSPDWHDSLPSTNSTLIDWIRGGDDLRSGYVLAAYDQTAGRGRFDRKWVAPAGQNLTFSFLVSVPQNDTQATSITMAVALGIVDYLRAAGLVAQTKWPNDVWTNDRKISGILAEMCERRHRPERMIVVGIGLNVNLPESAAAAIDRPATSMLIESGIERDVRQVLEDLLPHLGHQMDAWSSQGFAGIQQQWTENCLYVGESVSVGEDENVSTGILQGFGQQGQAQLRFMDGSIKEIWAGDLSLRPN